METRKKKAKQELQFLAAYLVGEVVYENGVQALKIDNSIGEGQVRCICFDDGLTAMEFDITLKNDISVRLNNACGDMVYFLYCLEGNCFHKFQENQSVAKLEELQTAVASNGKELLSEMLIKKDSRLILNLIRIDRSIYTKSLNKDLESVDTNTLQFFESFNKYKGYFHLGKINLEIGEYIKLLQNAKYVNDLSTLMQFEGICHLILAKQIEQFRFEMEYGKHPVTTLLKRELKDIGEVSDFIKNYPEVQHSITNLCSKSGLSAAKLQQGFRFIHDMTVGEYVRETRLKLAQQLLRTSEMNISEVVYTIGLTSRSYFCKIFKAKYRCSPKQYKKNVLQMEIQS